MTITAWLKIKPEIPFLNIKNIKSDQLKFMQHFPNWEQLSDLRLLLAWHEPPVSSPAQQAFEKPSMLPHSLAQRSFPVWKALQAASGAEVKQSCFVSRLNYWLPELHKLQTL